MVVLGDQQLRHQTFEGELRFEICAIPASFLPCLKARDPRRKGRHISARHQYINNELRVFERIDPPEGFI